MFFTTYLLPTYTLIRSTHLFGTLEYYVLLIPAICPDQCTHPAQGICNETTGKCTCTDGFSGDNCAGENFLFYPFGKDFKKVDFFFSLYPLNPCKPIEIMYIILIPKFLRGEKRYMEYQHT